MKLRDCLEIDPQMMCKNGFERHNFKRKILSCAAMIRDKQIIGMFVCIVCTSIQAIAIDLAILAVSFIYKPVSRLICMSRREYGCAGVGAVARCFDGSAGKADVSVLRCKQRE